MVHVSDGVLLSSATKVPKNAAKNYVFGFPRRDMVVMCSLLRTSRNRYLRTRTLSRIVLLLFPQASRCCLYREAAFLFYRLAARRCRADGTPGTPSPTGGLSRPPRRAGPMCPAARYACFPAGHAGPALHDSSAAALTGRRTLRAFIGGVPCGTSYPKGICSAALHCRTPSPTDVYRRRTGSDAGRAEKMPPRR